MRIEVTYGTTIRIGAADKVEHNVYVRLDYADNASVTGTPNNFVVQPHSYVSTTLNRNQQIGNGDGSNHPAQKSTCTGSYILDVNPTDAIRIMAAANRRYGTGAGYTDSVLFITQSTFVEIKQIGGSVGPTGPQGPPVNPSTTAGPPGPPGATSTVPGPDGIKGLAGNSSLWTYENTPGAIGAADMTPNKFTLGNNVTSWGNKILESLTQ